MTECCATTCVISRTREYNEMEFQEKFAIVQENPIYDTIPLIIIDKMGRKYSKGLRFTILSNEILLFFIKVRYMYNYKTK